MFYKIDPGVSRVEVDLTDYGFRVGDRLWAALRGDFQPTPVAADDDQNTTFRFGSKSVDASYPATFTTRSTEMLVLNHDRPLIDNSDPDDDYGVLVRAAAFTSGDDYFSFRGRSELPSFHGSSRSAGAGDDLVLMPNAALDGFNPASTFYLSAGNDEARAGGLGVRLDFGSGTDTLVLKGATLNWAVKENRDNDGVLDLRVGSEKYRITNAELLDRGGSRDEPLHEWHLKVLRERNGDLDIVFYEDGVRILKGGGKYDRTIGIDEGSYQAHFTQPHGRGSEQVELGTIDGVRNVSIRDGLSRSPSTDFVTNEKFMDTVFDHVTDAYRDAGRSLPWKDGAFTPFSPVTVEVIGATSARAAASLADDDAAHHSVAADYLLG